MRVVVVPLNSLVTITPEGSSPFLGAFGHPMASAGWPLLWGTDEVWFRLMGKGRGGKLRVFKRKA